MGELKDIKTLRVAVALLLQGSNDTKKNKENNNKKTPVKVL